MNIAVLTVTINRKSGSRAPLEVAKALRKEGNNVIVFALAQNFEKGAADDLEQNGIKIYIMHTSELFLPFILYKKLRNQFDIINYHATPSFFIGAKLSGLPIIRTYHGSQFNPITDKYFPKKPNLLTHLLNWLANSYIYIIEFLILHASDKILAISKYTRDEVKETFHLDSDFVYYGPTLAKEDLPEKKKQNKDITILSVSRIIPYKGYHRLIKLFGNLQKKYPNIQLVIAGSSPDKIYLQYLRQIAGEKIEILTNISDEKLIKVYQNADIYATFDHYMFFGMPLLEASAFSLPIVAIDRCAAPELIQNDKNGFLANDEKTFEKDLEELIQNPSLRKEMGERAYRFSKKFTWDNFGKKYDQWFQQILEKTRKRKLQTNYKKYLITLCVLGFIIRFTSINSHTFWFDEAFTYFVSKHSFASLIPLTLSDTTPPLYYLLLKLWISFSHQIWFMRFLSLIFGVLAIPVMFKLSQKITNTRTALFATALFTFSPIQIYFSNETRMYSLLVLEVLIISYVLLVYFNTKRTIYLLLIVSTGILGLYTHYYFIFVLLTLNLVFVTHYKKFHLSARHWIISQGIIALTFIPWLILGLQKSKPDCWCFNTLIGIPAMFASFSIGGMGVVTLKDYLQAPTFILIILILTIILMFGIFIYGVIRMYKIQKILLIFFFLPLLFITFVSFFHSYFSPRSLIFISPFYYLIISISIFSMNKLFKYTLSIIIVVLLFIVIFMQSALSFFYGPPLEKAAFYIKNHASGNEMILHTSLTTYYSFQYYHNYSYSEFLAKSSNNTFPAIFEILDNDMLNKKINQNYQSIWLVIDKKSTTPSEYNGIVKLIKSRYKLLSGIQYDTITLSHYSQK